ncbi:Peptide-N(4)-(N-acetyl-beta-glucosaminyl)asparagine amidase [Nymphaea thermarum]|nr:Peptide-N(4)-(N-acetyl-beta-glucosaminyl)asparagine amidase [Nymphaea thermarum]
MYSSIGAIDDASKLFNIMQVKDVISWTTMINMYGSAGCPVNALEFFWQMRSANVEPDMVSMVALLSACAVLGDLQKLKIDHNQIILWGLEFELHIENSLISVYFKCGDMQSADMIFSLMSQRSQVTCSAMISRYIMNGQAENAMKLMIKMVTGDQTNKMDAALLVNGLSAIADLANLGLCKQFPSYTNLEGFDEMPPCYFLCYLLASPLQLDFNSVRIDFPDNRKGRLDDESDHGISSYLVVVEGEGNQRQKMVARKLLVRHNSAQFDVDYETDDGLEVLKYQLFSLTLVPPEDQKLVGAGNRAIREDADLNSVTEFQLVTGSEGAEEETLFIQQYQHDQGTVGFEQRVRPYISQVLMYEDHSRQEVARKTVPMDELEEQALISLAKEGNFKPSKIEQDHAILLQLLFWFKKSFRWVNAPPCETCGCETNNVGMGVPLASESHFGGSRVELYRNKQHTKGEEETHDIRGKPREEVKNHGDALT